MLEIVTGIKQCLNIINNNILYIIAGLVVFCLFSFIYTAYKNICELLIKLVRNHLVRIDISMGTNELIDLAQQIWKIETKLKDIDISDTKSRAIKSAFSKIYSIFNLYSLEIKDYTGEKYNEGMNVEIRTTVKEEGIKTPYIKETISPMITIDKNIVKKAEVIKAISIDDEE